MSGRSAVRSGSLLLVVLAVCTVSGSGTQWARQPGDRVRDAFGPTLNGAASACRGACGPGCLTASCTPTVSYECVAPDQMRRVRTFACGTHQGCREHDDCMDVCRQRQQRGLDCEAHCHAEAIQRHGLEPASSWVAGGGPFDTARVTFEYTRDAPEAPEPRFRCPAGTRSDCTATSGRCVTDGGVESAPVFDAYEGVTGAMRVSGFRSGRVCAQGGRPSGVCEPAADIDVTGERTWYGFEFDYENATPSAPLQCSSSGAGDDFLGRALGQGLMALPADTTTEIGAMLGKIQGELGRGRSLKDVLAGASVRPIGEPAPAPAAAPEPAPGVPASVQLTSASGRLLVPMYELANGGAPGSVLVRDVRCTHNGSPVLETSFRLRFTGR